MPDREKVIKGLYHISNDTRMKGFMTYWGSYYDVATDALALLKAQEQEPIAPIRRSAHAQGADDVWYECGKCRAFLGINPDKIQFCAKCGREVKWG